jgi:hypothetical protein
MSDRDRVGGVVAATGGTVQERDDAGRLLVISVGYDMDEGELAAVSALEALGWEVEVVWAEEGETVDSSNSGHNRTVGMDGLEQRTVAGRAVRIDPCDGVIPVYDAGTGIMVALVYGEVEGAMRDLETDVLANGW